MPTTADPLPETQDPLLDRLRAFIRERSILRNGPYRLASGGVSDTFFDMKQTLLDPRGLDMVGAIIAELIRADDVQAVGGLVLGSCPVADAVALKSLAWPRPLTAFYVRKERKATGTQSLIEGPVVRGGRVVALDDVTTRGGSVLKAIEAVRAEWGCEVPRVVTIVDRESGARERLAEAGVKLTALYRMSEFMAG